VPDQPAQFIPLNLFGFYLSGMKFPLGKSVAHFIGAKPKFWTIFLYPMLSSRSSEIMRNMLFEVATISRESLDLEDFN